MKDFCGIYKKRSKTISISKIFLQTIHSYFDQLIVGHHIPLNNKTIQWFFNYIWFCFSCDKIKSNNGYTIFLSVND